MKSIFHQRIAGLIDITAEEVDHVVSLFSCLSLGRGEHWIREGEICNHLGFLEEGYMREYICDDAEEVTIHIGRPGDFIVPFSSYLQALPSQASVQAVSETKVWLIHRDEVEKLYSSSHKLESLGRKVTEQNFLNKEERVISFVKYSAEKRYADLLEKAPDIVQNVPLLHIASFLGMKPETLSRVRARIR